MLNAENIRGQLGTKWAARNLIFKETTESTNDDAKMLGFRAWFQITGNTLAGAPIRRDMPASLRIVSTPTDIESIKPLEVSVQKELRDGQIIINRNGEQYSITGQKL